MRLQYRPRRRCLFSPSAGKIPWRRKWQPNPVFSPDKSHGQRSLVGYSPQGREELDTTEWLSARARAHAQTHTHTRANEILHTILSESIAKMWWKSTSSKDQIFVQASVSPEVLLIRGKGRVKGKWWQEHRCLFILVVYTDWRFSTCHTSYIYFIFFSLCWVSHTVLFLVNWE